MSALDQQFGDGYFRSELRSYKKKGLGERAQLLAGFLEGQGLEGLTLLEIGSGMGALHLELLSKGAASAIGIDASSAAIQASDALADEMGFANRIEHRRGDFVELQDEIVEADIVLLDRVVCCYPEMEALMEGAAERAKRFVGLSMPRSTWWIRAGFRVINVIEKLLRRPFRAYYHDHAELDAVVTGQGFRKVYQAPAGLWETKVFERTG